MAAGTWTPVNSARTNILNGTFGNLAASSPGFKIALFTSASNIAATSTTYAALTGEVGTTNTGYTTGGIAVSPLALAGTTSVTIKDGTNPVWTAGTATLVAHYAVLYQVGGNVLAYCLLDSGGADVTTTSGNTLTVDAITNPILTLA